MSCLYLNDLCREGRRLALAPDDFFSGVEGVNQSTFEKDSLPSPNRFYRASRGLPYRSLRVADQIRCELARLITCELRDPRIRWVTVQSVKLSSDYAYANVYVTTLKDSSSELIALLNKASGYLRKLIYKRLSIHTVPIMRFFYDPTIVQAEKIDALLKEAKDSSSELAY